MSEPVSNAAIEDVLSSVRKLVSEDPGPERAASPPERLVLTPAFRVADSAPEASAKADMPEPTVQDTVEHDADAPTVGKVEGGVRSRLENRIAELEEAVGRTQEEWEPDGSKPDIDPLSSLVFHRWVDDLAGSAHDDTLTKEEIARDLEKHPLLDVEEVGEATKAAEAAQDQVEDLHVVPVEQNDAAAATAKDAPTQVAEDKVETRVGDDSAPAVVPDATESPARTHEPDIAAVADAAVAAVTAGEPGSEANAMDGVAPDDATAVNTDEVAIAATAAPETEAGPDSDEHILDEEALRDLVGRMLREELQGPIGERITRNVRRMVHREIQRAMSLKEFE